LPRRERLQALPHRGVGCPSDSGSVVLGVDPVEFLPGKPEATV
jgi:hypothetical protein